jgi:hypothetical protein
VSQRQKSIGDHEHWQLIRNLDDPQIEQDVGGDIRASRSEDRQRGSSTGVASGFVHGQVLGFTVERLHLKNVTTSTHDVLYPDNVDELTL